MRIDRTFPILVCSPARQSTTHTQSATQGGDGLPTNVQGETSPLHAAHRTNGGEHEKSATEPHSTVGERDEARSNDSPMTASVSEMRTSFHRSPSLAQIALQHRGGAEKTDAAQVEKPICDVPVELMKDRGKALTGDGTYYDRNLKVLLTGHFENGAVVLGKILSKHDHEDAELWVFEVENMKIKPTPQQILFGTCILPEYYATRPRFDGEAEQIKGDFDPSSHEFWQAIYGKPGASGEVNEVADKSAPR